MRIRVLKFGGTSLSSPELRQIAVSHIQTALAEGCAPVVVVSAMGRSGDPYATDTLLNLVLGVHPEMPPREIALLACCGEIISAVVMASMCLRAGIQAVALTGAQAGIRTATAHVGAAVESICPELLMGWISQRYVPIVAGFQGTTIGGELAVLDRGGSDTSSTAIGYALGAERVDIFTDVQGILTADPRIVPEARLIDALTFEQALLMASHGTKAIHPEAVKWAMKGPTPVYIRSIRDCGCWTCISDQIGSATRGVLGIACREKDNHTGAVALISEEKLPLDVMRTTLHSAEIPLSWLELSTRVISLMLPLEHMARTASILHARFIRAESYHPSLPLPARSVR